MTKNRWGFRAKLLIAGLLVQTLTIAIFAWGIADQLEKYLASGMVNRIEHIKPILKAALLVPLQKSDYASVGTVVDELISSSDFMYIAVSDTQRNLIKKSDLRTNLQRDISDHSRTDQIPETIQGMQAVEVLADGKTIGFINFQMLSNTDQDLIKNLIPYVGYWGLASIIIFILILWNIGQALTRPLLQLADASEAMRQGRYDVELPIHRNDEIGKLVDAFNQMIHKTREKISTLVQSENIKQIYLDDINAQKIILEKALDQAQGATRTKTEFLSNMSHEIRTPMNAILGFSQLLKETDLSPRQSEYINSVHTSATSLLSIFNDILDFSKLEAGKVKLVIQSFSISDLTQSAINIFSFQLKEKNLLLNMAIDTDVPKYVQGDATRIRQILVNLIGNAIKFTEHGQIDVTVSTKVQTDDRLFLKFSVNDTGVGMSQDQRARIFTPFAQGDSSSTKRFGGSGLGLAISRHLIDMMDGELTVESTLGRGSCVSFTCYVQSASDHHLSSDAPHLTLPPDETTAGRLSPLARSLTGVRVLLAEDDKFNAMLALAFLHKLGMQVRQAGNGLEAIEALKQQPFDIILMDLQMPDLDGLSATKIIKATWGESAPPIVAMSGAAQTEDRLACLEAGMVEHISKPVDFAGLQEVLLRCLQPAATSTPANEEISLMEIDMHQLVQLMHKLEQSLLDNLTSARRVCDDIASTVQATPLAIEFRPIAELTRRLKYKEALLGLSEFRQKFVDKYH